MIDHSHRELTLRRSCFLRVSSPILIAAQNYELTAWNQKAVMSILTFKVSGQIFGVTLKPRRRERKMVHTYCLMLASIGILLVEVTGSEVCEVPKLSGTTRASFSSHQNKTGHWLAQVQLDTMEDVKKPTSTKIDVERSTAVCKNSSATQITMTIMGTPPQQTLPDYEFIPGVGQYKFHAKSAVWWEARQICASEGAHLAIINSDEESAALRQLFARYPKLQDVAYNEIAFIGFHDLYVDGQFLTVFDEPLNSTGFTKWDSGQPDNFRGGSGENCGSIFRNGLLNDAVCHLKFAFICERELS